jgi:hypothetical protein
MGLHVSLVHMGPSRQMDLIYTHTCGTECDPPENTPYHMGKCGNTRGRMVQVGAPSMVENGLTRVRY